MVVTLRKVCSKKHIFYVRNKVAGRRKMHPGINGGGNVYEMCSETLLAAACARSPAVAALQLAVLMLLLPPRFILV